MTNTSWIFVGDHPEDIADGRMVSLGAPPVTLDPEDPHNKRMIERGVLIPNSEAATKVADEIADEAATDTTDAAPATTAPKTTKGGSK